MDRKFETTYNQDYKHRLENRELALKNKIDENLPGSCFSPRLECTVPVISGDVSSKNIDFESEVKHKDFSQCGMNRFVENLAKTHPELYANIEANHSWEKRASGSPFKSSYQLDYDRLPEHPPCPLKNDSESSRWPDWKYFQRGCNGFLCNGESGPDGIRCPCQLCPYESEEAIGKKSKFECVYAISNIPKSYITSSHWPERDWQRNAPNRTEYRDEVGRLGKILQRENVHDHSRCTSVHNCRHHFFL